MPLIRCVVSAPTQPATIVLPSEGGPKSPFLEGVGTAEVLDAATLEQLSKCVQQLSELSLYAGEMFNGLVKEASICGNRVASLKHRVDRLRSTVPEVERKMEAVANTTSMQVDRREYRPPRTNDNNHFVRKTENASVRAVYEAAQPLPNLQILDEYREDKQTCVKFYSYPQFFFDEWISLMSKENEERIKKKKAKKKLKSEERRQIKKVKDLDIKKYSNTGELLNTKKGRGADSNQNVASANSLATSDGNISSAEASMEMLSPEYLQPPPPAPAAFTAPAAAPPTMRPMTAINPALANRLSMMPTSAPPPPPPGSTSASATPSATSAGIMGSSAAIRASMMGPPGGMPPPPPPSSSAPRIGAPLVMDASRPMVMPPPSMMVPPPSMTAPPIPMFAAPPKAAVPSAAAAPPPPPPPPPAQSPSAPPPPPAPSVSQDASSAAPAAPDERSNLLSSIRGGIQLKKVDKEAVPERRMPETNDVTSILMRRIALEMSDSDSDDEDDDEDDDEWA